MHERKETRHRLYRPLGSGSVGLPAESGVCGTFAARCKAAARGAGELIDERQQERRHQLGTEPDADSRMDRTADAQCSRARAGRSWPSVPHASRFETRLLAVGLHPVSTGLQTPARRAAWMLPADRLHGRWRPCEPADRAETSALATCPKNANAGPATGRSMRQPSRHGTNSQRGIIEIAEFVPPRDKTPCFWGSLRPATGHLYREAISTRERSSASGRAKGPRGPPTDERHRITQAAERGRLAPVPGIGYRPPITRPWLGKRGEFTVEHSPRHHPENGIRPGKRPWLGIACRSKQGAALDRTRNALAQSEATGRPSSPLARRLAGSVWLLVGVGKCLEAYCHVIRTVPHAQKIHPLWKESNCLPTIGPMDAAAFVLNVARRKGRTSRRCARQWQSITAPLRAACGPF